MTQPLETHPFAPFVPEGAKFLFLGTFPPKPLRWGMDFYYPNPSNDFWRIMGIIYFDDPWHLFTADHKHFREEEIKEFLRREKIALNDTGYRVRRLKDNASDKFLDIVEPVDLASLLAKAPDCTNLATTGEKAAEVLARLTATTAPAIGEVVETVWAPDGRTLRITRLPSTSRAYPLAIAKKAEAYRKFLK